MTPKTIHYCWFGKKPLPDLARKCIASWKKFLPDYKIKEWNEDNFDITIIPYTREAYEKKKYAFVSDYARFWIIYNNGGVYFDTDVELIASPYSIINKGPFMACENTNELWEKEYPAVAPGLGLASEANNSIFEEILNSYNKTHFLLENGQLDLTTVVTRVSGILSKFGLEKKTGIQQCRNINIYPPEYFCPLNHLTGRLQITKKTVAIHHYMASWKPKPQKSLTEFIWTKLHLPKTNIRVRLKNFFIKQK